MKLAFLQDGPMRGIMKEIKNGDHLSVVFRKDFRIKASDWKGRSRPAYMWQNHRYVPGRVRMASDFERDYFHATYCDCFKKNMGPVESKPPKIFFPPKHMNGQYKTIEKVPI